MEGKGAAKETALRSLRFSPVCAREDSKLCLMVVGSEVGRGEREPSALSAAGREIRGADKRDSVGKSRMGSKT